MPGVFPLLMDDVDIVVDIDNTIADTQGELTRRFGTTADQYPCPAVPEGFFESEEGINLLCSAKPFPGAADALRILADRGWHITYYTARPGSVLDATERWLTDNGFPMDGGIHGGLSQDLKVDVVELLLRPMVVFEDDPVTAVALLEHVPFVLVKNWPYNRYLFPGNRPPRDGLLQFDKWDKVSSVKAMRKWAKR